MNAAVCVSLTRACTGSALRRSGTDVLLLLRNSKHNDLTWGLPGGNSESGDASLLDTAKREGREEMGAVPPCNASAQILTK